MLKIMIVEDDVMYRYALRTVINWEEYGFAIVEEAINGKDAINKLVQLEPDVLITDISMPELDGIELTKHVKRHYPHIKIIVLSSYDDYRFVRDALILGAEDYILKFELEEDKLVNLLMSIKDKRDEENLNKTLENGNKFMNELITGQWQDEVFISNKLRTIKENFTPKVVMNIAYVGPLTDKKYKNLQFFHELLSNSNKQCDFMLGIYYNKCCMLIDVGSIKSEYKIHSILVELGHYIIETLEENGIANCQIGVSDLVCDVDHLYSHYRQAEIALQYSIYEKNKKIFFYHDNLISNKCQIIDDLLNKLRESTLKGDIHQVEGNIDEIFHIVSKHKFNPYRLKKVLLDLYLLHYKVTSELKEEHTDNLRIINPLINEEVEDISILSEEYLNFYRLLCKKINLHKNYSSSIQRTMAYIQKHYKSPDLTVDKIAFILNITPNYLSNIFKKETGMRITEYIHNLKIMEAKDLLLSSNMKVYEIADEVGFNNVTYFCTLFKRKTGVTVKEYQNNNTCHFSISKERE